MKQFLTCLFLGGALCLPACAAPLSSNARTVVPSAVQQIISVDYRQLRDSQSALALRDRVLPDNIKQFETALRAPESIPIKTWSSSPSSAIAARKESCTESALRKGRSSRREFLQKMKARKIKPEKYLLSYLYPMGSGMQMVFLDPTTILFGENAAIKGAIDVRDNGAESVQTNNTINDLITSVQDSPVWSVLDQEGTQYMMRSALGTGGVSG